MGRKGPEGSHQKKVLSVSEPRKKPWLVGLYRVLYYPSVI